MSWRTIRSCLPSKSRSHWSWSASNSVFFSSRSKSNSITRCCSRSSSRPSSRTSNSRSSLSTSSLPSSTTCTSEPCTCTGLCLSFPFTIRLCWSTYYDLQHLLRWLRGVLHRLFILMLMLQTQDQSRLHKQRLSLNLGKQFFHSFNQFNRRAISICWPNPSYRTLSISGSGVTHLSIWFIKVLIRCRDHILKRGYKKYSFVLTSQYR